MSASSDEASSDERDEQRHIAGRAGVVAAGTLLSRILGLGRDLVLAALFSRAATDAWMIAWQIPNMLRQLLAEGAIQTAVLPVLTDVKEKQGSEAARAYFRAIRGLSLTVLVVVSGLGILFSDALVGLFAAGFRDRPGQFELTSALTRWVFPYIFFMGTAALGVAALNTYKRFVVSSFAPALLNVSFIAFALLLPGWLGARGWPRIYAMALGALVGGALQVGAQWPSLRKIGFGEFPSFRFRHPAVGETLSRLAPSLLGIGVYYLDVIIGRRLLSELSEGAVTYFSYALRLCDLSQGVFIMALSTATLPTLAAHASRGEYAHLGRTLAFSLRHALFVGIAATVFFVVLAEPVVSLLFQRMQFGPQDTRETAQALMAQGLSIFLVAGVRQLVLVYFALGDTRTPVVIAGLDVVVFASSAYLLRENFGHVGVGLGVSLARVAQFTLLAIGLRRHPTRMPAREVLGSAGRTTVAAFGAGASAWVATWLLGIGVGADPLLRPVPAIVGTATFALVFFGLAALLRSEELKTIVVPIQRRFHR